MTTTLYAERAGATLTAIFTDPVAADEFRLELAETGWQAASWPTPVDEYTHLRTRFGARYEANVKAGILEP